MNGGKGCSNSTALGMESGAISDSQITSTPPWSSGNDQCLAKHGRLHAVAANGGTCSAFAPATAATDEWLQVDFLSPKCVTGFEIKGRAKDLRQQFVTSLYFWYSMDEISWKRAVKDGLEQIGTGLVDCDTVRSIEFDEAVFARYVRINPRTWNEHPSLQVEISGCIHKPLNLTLARQFGGHGYRRLFGGKKLAGHELLTVSESRSCSPMYCAATCNTHDGCDAFNYKVAESPGSQCWCELKTIGCATVTEDQMMEDPHYKFYIRVQKWL